MKVTFTTFLIQAEGKQATGIQIPAGTIEGLKGGKKPRLKVQIGDFVYSTAVGKYGDTYMIPVSAERREAAGIQAGDEIEVTVELDTVPQVIEVPDDLAQALAEHNISEVFDTQAPSKRKEFVRQVTSAKAQETRERRIDKIIQQLTEK